MMGVRYPFLFYFGLLHVHSASCLCYFGQDMQGFYVTQSTVSRGTDIDYLEVVILHDAIPVWGVCHKRFGTNVILYDMAGDIQCLRCFHLVARSSYIMEIHTEGLERCYTNEAAALTRCPTREAIIQGATREIMLYKTKNLIEARPLLPIYCPINGKYKATYDLSDGTQTSIECPEANSEVGNCPKGNEIVISFKKCSFHDFEKKFECLGSWLGPEGQKYLALLDPTVSLKTSSKGLTPNAPRYRCALLQEDAGERRVYLTLSSDSTCFNNLHSAWEGYESLVLRAEEPPTIPRMVTATKCSFPSWAQGKWEHLQVNSSVMTFMEHNKIQTFTAHCLGPTVGGLVPVYTQSHCGEETFACLALEERSSNVMEFQISVTSSNYYHDHLCFRPSTLKWPTWMTQGRVDRFRQSPCPVAGEYAGMIPDEPSMCAKLYSDCNNAEIMFYTVSSCANRSEVYEEREYRCLGQWTESGVTFTYTERRDVEGHECFAGVVDSANEIFIVEAGIDCQRGARPLSKGMKLSKQAVCQNAIPINYAPDPQKEVTHSWWSTTEVSWGDENSITNSNSLPSPSRGNNSLSMNCIKLFLLSLCIMIYLH